MRLLTESNDIAQDTEALSRRLYEEGYLFLRDGFDKSLVDRLRSEIMAVVARHGWTADGSDPADLMPSREPLLENAPEWWPVYKDIQKLESFHRLAYDENVTGILERLFGEEVVVHLRKIARLNYPVPERSTTPFHQDMPLIGGTIDFFTCWSPLADVPAEGGGLRLLPRSHLKGLRRVHFDRTKEAAGLAWVDVDEEEAQTWVSADFRAGDMLLFHSLVVHAGVPNRSKRIRVSVDYRYQPASETVNSLSMEPHYYERSFDVPPWEEFTEGWTSLDWIKTPDGIQVEEGGMPAKTGNVEGNIGSRGGESRFVDSSAFKAQIADTTQVWQNRSSG